MSSTDDYYFSIMIISAQNFCERLKTSILHEAEKLYEKEVIVKLTENVVDILNSEKPDTAIDFVVVVVDAMMTNALEKCKRDISLIMSSYAASRMCIVNGTCRSGGYQLAKDLIEFSDQFNIPYFNGEIMNNASCRATAKRILKLASFSSGYTTGLTGIIPTPKDLGLFFNEP